MAKVKTDSIDEKVFTTKGSKLDEAAVLSTGSESASTGFDPHFITEKIVEFGMALTGMPLYDYQKDSAYRIIHSVVAKEGETITMLFSRQCIAEGSLVYDRGGLLCKIEEHPESWVTDTNRLVYKVCINGGYTLYCTDNHPLLKVDKKPTSTNKVEGCWSQLKELKKGDLVQVLKYDNRWGNDIIEYSYTKQNGKRLDSYKGSLNITEELAELLGWLTADGYINVNGQSSKFTNVNSDYLDRVEYLVSNNFTDILCKRYPKGKGYDILFTTESKDRHNTLKDFIRCMDYKDKFPMAIKYFSKNSVQAFFRGMYPADGYVSKSKGQLYECGLSCGQNVTYAKYVREYLNKLGIRAKLKQELMAKNLDGTLFNRVIFTGRRNAKVFKDTIREILGKNLPVEGNPIATKRYERVEYVGEDLEILEYRNIISIEPSHHTTVYDMEVPNKGWFLCDGVKVHNSGKCFVRGTMIQTYDFGKKVIKPVEEICNGDYVVSPNNLAVEVKNCHNGMDEIFTVVPQSDFLHKPYGVNSKHLLAVYDLTDNSYKNISIGEYLEFTIEHKMKLRGYARTLDFSENMLYRFNIIPNGKGEYFGFEVESNDKLFLLEDYTVVHNSETMAFVIDTLCVILPVLGKVIPELAEFKTGFRVGLFAPQSDQVTTTYQRAMSRLKSSNAAMVMEDGDIDTKLMFDARLVLSNGSSLIGQTAAKTSKIESKTYDLIIIEEAQDTDDLVVSKSIESMAAACVHVDTEINLLHGKKVKAKDVVVGDIVRGYDFTKGIISYGKVSWCQPPCKKLSYRLIFTNGIELLCSFDHPILVNDNGTDIWVETENLTLDSYVKISKIGVMSTTKLLRKDLIGEVDVANFTVDGINTYLANGVVTHNTFGTFVKLGTTGMRKGDFWYEIQRNVKRSTGAHKNKLRYHFEFNYLEIIKQKRIQYAKDGNLFHLNYEKFIKKQIEKRGIQSDSFKLAFALIWALEGGMFLSDTDWNNMLNRKKNFIRVVEPNWDIRAGIDIAKDRASTVITIGRIIPEFVGVPPRKEVLQWVELKGMDYELQHQTIVQTLIDYGVSLVYIDYTGVGKPVVDRLTHAIGHFITIVPYTFSRPSKSEMWLALQADILAKRFVIPATQAARDTQEYKNAEIQFKGLTKRYEGGYLVAEKGSEHELDDVCDSSALFVMAGNAELTASTNVEFSEENPFYQNAGVLHTIQTTSW